MAESRPASGNILVYAEIRDQESKSHLAQLLDDLPGERISSTLYEVFTEEWDEGLWDEEAERMQTIIDPDVDSLVFWHAVGGTLVRTCLAGRSA